MLYTAAKLGAVVLLLAGCSASHAPDAEVTGQAVSSPQAVVPTSPTSSAAPPADEAGLPDECRAVNIAKMKQMTGVGTPTSEHGKVQEWLEVPGSRQKCFVEYHVIGGGIKPNWHAYVAVPEHPGGTIVCGDDASTGSPDAPVYLEKKGQFAIGHTALPNGGFTRTGNVCTPRMAVVLTVQHVDTWTDEDTKQVLSDSLARIQAIT